MKATSLKSGDIRNFSDSLKILPFILPLIPYFVKYSKISLQNFSTRFRNPFLRKAVRYFLDGPGWPMPDFPLLALTGFVKNSITGAGTPEGGSTAVVMHMADYYHEMGGEMILSAKVKDLLVENDRVKGIVLEDGSVYSADEIIWAGDGHNLIFNILKGKYLSEQIRQMYENWRPVQPLMHVMIGVDMDFSGEPHNCIFETDTPVSVAGKEFRWLSFLHHCHDKISAPEGKSAVEVWYPTDYDYWEELSRDRKKYLAEKKRIADDTIRELDKRWPGFASKVEVVDVPTPHTYHRYTGNWKASPDGWYLTTQNLRQMEPVRRLPGLSGLHMAGQWTAPYTGTIIATLTGRQIIQILCKKDGKAFKTKAKPMETRSLSGVNQHFEKIAP